MSPDNADVRRRHSAIPQEPLPLGEVAKRAPGKPKKRTSIKSVAFGSCPICPNKKVGQIRTSDGLMWREHNRVMHNGARIRCSGSGTPVDGGAS